MTNPVHMDTSRGNSICGLRDHSARLTADPDLVTCANCKASWRCRETKRHRQEACRPRLVRATEPSAVRRIRADASAYLRRALAIIERLPIRRTA